MKTKRWAMLAGGIMLVGLLLLVTRAAAEDVGETCVNVSDNVAVAACTRAIRSGGHNAHRLAVLYGNRCAAYINNGKTDEALSDCNQAIQLDPKNAVAYANRCAAHINKGETDDALSDCNQAIQLDPKNATAFHNRAAKYSAKRNYDRAIADLDQAIQLDPRNTISYNGRCAARIKKGEPLRGPYQEGRDRSSTERLQSSDLTRSEKCDRAPQPRGLVLCQR
jgi:tetratricopeptide (TPR) repeat protein